MNAARTRDELLCDAFVRLAATLVSDYDVVEVLHRLVQVSCELLPATAAGILLDDRGRLSLVAASNQQAELLEVLQGQNDAGPCVDCIRTGEATLSRDLAQDVERWPVFAPAARKAGYDAVTAIPLRVNGKPIGALNLFHEQPGGLDPTDQQVAQAFADVAAICVTQQRLANRRTVLAEQLEQALVSRVALEQAKGMLAERHDLDVDRAFAALRSFAREHNLKLTDVAGAVLRGEVDPMVAARPRSAD